MAILPAQFAVARKYRRIAERLRCAVPACVSPVGSNRSRARATVQALGSPRLYPQLEERLTELRSPATVR